MRVAVVLAGIRAGPSWTAATARRRLDCRQRREGDGGRKLLAARGAHPDGAQTIGNGRSGRHPSNSCPPSAVVQPARLQPGWAADSSAPPIHTRSLPKALERTLSEVDTG